ncbi:MAG TPA: cold shock domain-containing protein [Anaerolineae bacterium]|nr:cold shock domain-containing protein [Anaerolineae bacterium]HQK12628.1 cold shock domain-containing protein [Anaerolineae bacterium]
MTFQDQLLTCAACGKTFIYRIEEQRYQAELGFPVEMPDLCPECRKQTASAPGLRAGVVKWVREDKHFGFIMQRDGSKIFFHHTGVVGDPEQVMRENAPVWYEVISTDRGPQAVNVHLRE